MFVSKIKARFRSTDRVEPDITNTLLAALKRAQIDYKLQNAYSDLGNQIGFEFQVEDAPVIFSTSKAYAVFSGYMAWRKPDLPACHRNSESNPMFENLITTWSQLERSSIRNQPDRQQFSIERRIGTIAPSTYSYSDFESINDLLFNLVKLGNADLPDLASYRSEQAKCEMLLKYHVSQMAEQRSIEPGSIWVKADGDRVTVAAAQNSFPYIVLLANKTWVSRKLFLAIDDRGLLSYTEVGNAKTE